jgi:hypothetical protein
MKLPDCDREQEVVDALRSGRWASAWGAELRQHAEDCAVCAEVAFADQEFQREAELARTELQQSGTRLPSAGLVWWKAQLAARRAAEQRAAAHMVLVERVAIALGALAALGLGIWKWSIVAGWLSRFGVRRALRGYTRVFPDRGVVSLVRAGVEQPTPHPFACCHRSYLFHLDGLCRLCGLAGGLTHLQARGAGKII